MPNTTRRSTTDATADDKEAAVRSDTSEEAGATAKAASGEAAAQVSAAGSGAGAAMRQIITAPAAVARAVADDMVTTVRRPDAVLYLGGLVGLAALGVLEWPVAAAAGVGLAVANGIRRVPA